MIINFTEYKGKVKARVLERKAELDFLRGYQELPYHSWDGAWLAYALSKDGVKGNILLSQVTDELLRWFNSNRDLRDERDIGAAGILSFIMKEMEDQSWDKVAAVVTARLSQLHDKESHKFSIFNNPELLFASVIGALPVMDERLREFVRTLADKNRENTKLLRRLFYSAVVTEISPGAMRLSNIDLNRVRMDELIPLVWFVERYQDHCDLRPDKVWDIFCRNKDNLWIERGKSPYGFYEPSELELALLYESLAYETKAVNPRLLFANYPLHPRIKEACRDLFEKGEYANAVFEAAKGYNEFVKEKSGVNNQDGRSLMQLVFKPDNPVLKVNPLKTESDRNEQEGVRLLSEGIVAAFRNPKGHTPKSKIRITPYEALDQIVTISLLAMKVEKAQKV